MRAAPNQSHGHIDLVEMLTSRSSKVAHRPVLLKSRPGDSETYRSLAPALPAGVLSNLCSAGYFTDCQEFVVAWINRGMRNCYFILLCLPDFNSLRISLNSAQALHLRG
jgi:hypothetical protein